MKKKNLIIGTQATPTHADSNLGNTFVDSQLYTNIFEPLISCAASPVNSGSMSSLPVVIDDDHSFLPNLCESWSLSDDHTGIRIKLRKGVYSHWGNELTSADLKYTVNRSYSVKASSFYFLNSFLGLPSPDYLHIVDDYTVDIVTPRPTGVALKLLSSLWFTVLDELTALKHTGARDSWSMKWLSRNSCGWGPYKITEWNDGRSVGLTACDNYWKGIASIDSVFIKAVPERATRIRMLENGEIDIAERLLPREIEYLRGKDSINVISSPTSSVYYLIMNCRVEPFNDVRVRKAMNYACPQDEIIKTVFRGMAAPMKSACSPVQPGYTESFWEYDYNPDKAAKLLEQAGYSNGFSVELSYPENSYTEEEVCTIIRDSFAKIRVKVSLNKMPLTSFSEKLHKKEHIFASKFSFTAVRDPSYWGLWYKSNTFLNYQDLRDDELDLLLDEQSVIMDPSERARFSRKVQKRIADLAPVVNIAYPMTNNALRADISGCYHVNPDCHSYHWRELQKN